MKYIKTIITSIDLDDYADQYAPDKTAVVMRKLSERYLNKCHFSMLITKILRVLHIDKVIMSVDRLDGNAMVNVHCEVEGIVLENGEILAGCEVKSITTNGVLAEHNLAKIKIANKESRDSSTNVMNILQPGIKIPVVVRMSRYTLNHSAIAVIAEPYVPTKSLTRYYKVVSSLNSGEIDKLRIIFENLEELHEEHKELSKVASYKFFSDILYPYKNVQKFELKPIFKELGLKKLPYTLDAMQKVEKGIFVETDETPRDSGIIYYSDIEEGKVTSVDLLSISAYDLFAMYLKNDIMYLENLRNMIVSYPTPKDLVPKAYWSMCLHAKQ